MSKLFTAIIVISLLALGASDPVLAQESSKKESPSELAQEGVERLLQALNALVQMIPQYEMPEVLDNGDIIIRRKWPDGEQPEDPDYDETNA